MANRIFLFACLFFCSSAALKAQTNKNLNWIILVDEKLAVMHSTPEFIVTMDNDSLMKFRSTYYPGNISIDEENFNQLTSSKVKSINLEILYYTHDKQQSINHYAITIPKGFLADRYLIIEIYNLKLREYRKKFKPHNSKATFVVQLRSSNQTLLTPN